MSNFAENLRHICGFHESTSQVCRAIGVNRQQFNKYLSGASVPSAYNLNRISKYLGVEANDLFLEPAQFASKYRDSDHQPMRKLPIQADALIARAFPGNPRQLRKYTGYYRSYFVSSESPDHVFCSLVRLNEQDGYVFSRTIERSRPTTRGKRVISKYSGLVTYLERYLFVSEFEVLTRDSVVETILYAPYRNELNLLSGLTFGTTASHRRMPFASKTVWKYLGKSIDAKSELKKCGNLNTRSPVVPHDVFHALDLDAKSAHRFITM